jgi:LysM repeat protein
VRKWTKSACVVIAMGILSLLAVAGSQGPGHAAQATISIASSTQTAPVSEPGNLMTVAAAPVAAASTTTWVVRPGDTLSAIAAAFGLRGGWQALYAANRHAIGSDPGLIRPGTTLSLPVKETPMKYSVAPGDTLSSIAGALAVPGGWQALYAANRRVIGANPGLIRPGTILVAPAPAAAKPAPPASGPGSGRPAPPPAASTPVPARTPAPASTPTPAGTPLPNGAPQSQPVPGSGTAADGVMPSWLKGTLLAAGLLTLLAFAVEPTLVIVRRRRDDDQVAGPNEPRGLRSRGQRAAEQRAARKMARIIQADHERLIVTYSVSDDTVYLLTPPGEDPRAVLRAARLVLPEDTYEELAGHLGVPSGWRE